MGALVALVGAPNSGKTTLFNWLTGAHFKTVNYPGSTVDCLSGTTLPVYGERVAVIDTPGVYSLHPQAADEEVTFELLTGQNKFGNVSVVVAVIDATVLERQLYVVKQLQEAKFPIVVALTMSDLSAKAGLKINIEELSQSLGVPIVPIDGRLGGGVKELMRTVLSLNSGESPDVKIPSTWDPSRVEQEMKSVANLAERVSKGSRETLANLMRLRRWDGIVLHPVWGLVVFGLVMAALFSSVFWLARPIMDLVDAGFAWLASHAVELFGGGAFGDFVGNGLIAGAGAVFVFVPQIFILFFGMYLLEDSGYLARAATLIDRPLQIIGLSGRSFVPLLSGFACAVPGVMAVRNLRSKREKMIATFIIPLMTCSARLPVYALLLYFLFKGEPAWKPGLALALLYFVSAILGGIAAALLNRMLKREKVSSFMLELPFYRKPQWRVVLRTALVKTRSYIVRAGPTIFGFLLILWVGTHFPKIEGTDSQQLKGSVVGQIGKTIEPVFLPMGADWRTGVSLISAFVAREVFVSSLAVILNVTDNVKESQHSLLSHMAEAQREDGAPLFTAASVTSLIVFFLIALQCLSTTSIVWREMHSWKFAAMQLVILNVVAYVLAIATYQILTHSGWS